MTVVDIAGYVVAGAMAASRILESTKPFWSVIPPKVATFLPSLVAMLPVLASKMGVAHSELDFVNALIVSGALLLPGAGISSSQSKSE